MGGRPWLRRLDTGGLRGTDRLRAWRSGSRCSRFRWHAEGSFPLPYAMQLHCARGKPSNCVTPIKDKKMDVRFYAAQSLGGIGLEAKAAVPALLETLKDNEWLVRGEVVIALGSIKADAKVVIPALIGALKDEHVCSDASRALREFRATSGAGSARCPQAEGCQCLPWASSALRNIGGVQASEIVPTLIVALKDKDSKLRYSAAVSLQAIGVEARAAVPALRDALKDEQPIVRSHASQGTKGNRPRSREKSRRSVTEFDEPRPSGVLPDGPEVRMALVPKLLFGNALRETPVSRPLRAPRGGRETEFREARSQTGVWERGTRRQPLLQ